MPAYPWAVASLTRGQLAAVAAHVQYGTGKEAAHALGVSPRTLEGHLYHARVRLHCDTTEQAAVLLAQRGELRVEGRE